MPQYPKPPPPRTDLDPPEGMSDSDYQEYLTELKADWPAAWRITDGTLWLEHMPAEMAPKVGMVDGPVSLTPEDPLYGKYAAIVPREFDYEGVEVPSEGAGGDTDGERKP